MGSWNHMGHTGNMIIKDFIRQMCVLLENSLYFGDGDASIQILIHQSPVVNSPHKGQWHRALMLSLICSLINSWVNNREAGDLRCHHTHYDITVMGGLCVIISPPPILNLSKPASILQMIFSNAFLDCDCIFIQISLTNVQMGPLDLKWSLVHVIDCCTAGNKHYLYDFPGILCTTKPGYARIVSWPTLAMEKVPFLQCDW